ncbi:hypothetical protein FLAV_01618 [Flavobacteriales bacterium]|nr:hypothetical protein [Flavobacteriales bacterium]MCL4815961.1 DUF3822 family protein [Flavobacteriales bacterium]WKZ74292.1 MAG: DUF3822 family protein [Vicingaceae bacterium]GIK70646.1 MAG: hypothetical protein BroJett020_19410 [Bacteroidota bacterium]CAG0978147.1 hypothetical protein FLAV_01618 [Flavobacteriales bacterium]
MAYQDISVIASYQDESLLRNQNASGLEVLMQLQEHSLTYALFDKSQRKILCLESFSTQQPKINHLCNYLFQQKLSQIPINKIRIAFTSPYSTLVPESLYQSNKINTFLSFNFSTLPQNATTLSNKLTHLHSYNIYAVPSEMYEVSHLFKNVSTYHFATPLLESFAINFPNSTTKSALIHIQDSHFELLIFSSHQLVLFNSFTYKTPEDIAYYILFTLEQLKISPKEINAIVAGEIEKKSDYYSILYTYIKHLKLAQRPKEINYSYVLNEIPSHYYYLLFNLVVCE